MTKLQQLEQLMVKHGAVIRAIPESVTAVMEKDHASHYPNGHIMYLPEFKREMLITTRTPKNAGKFLLLTNAGIDAQVRFGGRAVYNSLTDVLQALTDLDQTPGAPAENGSDN